MCNCWRSLPFLFALLTACSLRQATAADYLGDAPVIEFEDASPNLYASGGTQSVMVSQQMGESAAQGISAPVLGGTESTPVISAVAPAPADAAKAAKAKADKAKAEKKKKEDLKKAVNGAYKGVFYDNNFAFINNPKYDQSFVGDRLKQMEVGDQWNIDMGGQYRMRFHDEQNIRGLGLTGRDDQFLLHRTRLFANARYGDGFRLFGEFIDAESNYENFAPRQIEVDRHDFLNLFGDLRFWEGPQGTMTLRAGRQELLYGSQRLISPLDWANTRQKFDGAKLLWQGENWNIDAFYTRPVTVRPYAFDTTDYQREFMGTFASYKAIKDHQFDFYYLRYNDGLAPRSAHLKSFVGA